MFGPFHRKPKASPPPPDIRGALFGDLPVNAYPPENSDTQTLEPWKSFVAARQALAAGRIAEAVGLWHRIIEMPDLESRHYVQAWHFLRHNNVMPSADVAKRLLGVVVEVPMNGGLDLLAAYPDHHARYFNYSGAAVIWEHPDDSLDATIDALLFAGSKVLRAIGPWTGPRPVAPMPGQMRLNLLSPSGLHFGQGPMNVLANEPLAKPAVDAATILMKQLIARSNAVASR